MTTTALNNLDRATTNFTYGYFIMIEASRIDHAGHASDPAAHVHDSLVYKEVLACICTGIDALPDTMMLGGADHECGGVTLNGINPLPLPNAGAGIEHLTRPWDSYDGPDFPGYFRREILSTYGLGIASDAEVNNLLASSSRGADRGRLLASRAGVNCSPGGHTASDVTWHGYAAGRMGRELLADMAGSHDNTELPRYLEEVLGIKMDETTAKWQKNGMGWVG